MQKTKITRFIEKYFLGGLVENALWDVKNNVLTTRDDGDGTSFKAMVAMKEFDVEDCQLPVYDTDKLTKLFSVLESDVTLNVQKMDDTPIAVNAKDKDTTIRKNLASLFKAQISVGKNDLWYAAKGGKDIKLVPSEEKFNRGLENVRFDYRGETKGSGYTFTLVAHTIDKDIDVMKIQIVFRFKNGQMYGNPSTTSSYKMMVNDYTDIFGS